jgi:hypothetical protein
LLTLSSLTTAYAATKPCDVMPERCRYGADGVFYFYPPGYRMPDSIAMPAAGALKRKISGGGAQTRTTQYAAADIALKRGETAELGDIWFVNKKNCKSLLKGTPDVEILDGPHGVTAAVNVAEVVPRSLGCADPVAGGKLVITAKDIQDYATARTTFRIKYRTLDGDRQQNGSLNITLFPTN